VIGETAVVIDSSAYVPQTIVEKHGLLVAPLSVEIDGAQFLEGVDITPDDFYLRLPDAKTVTTSQPSVGRFLELYKEAAEAGAREIISIHIGSNISGTVQSARLASESSAVPVTVVDTGQASFAAGLCVLEALDALACGTSVTEVSGIVQRASGAVGNTFVVKALDLARRGGRLVAGETEAPGVSVLALTAEGMKVVGAASSIDDAVDLMAGHVESSAQEASGKRLRVGVGHGAAPEIAAALRERVAGLPGVEEVIEYVVGPVIGAHTGAGTAGAVFLARPI
jgi:DegV family protein with EDD domain